MLRHPNNKLKLIKVVSSSHNQVIVLHQKNEIKTQLELKVNTFITDSSKFNRKLIARVKMSQ